MFRFLGHMIRRGWFLFLAAWVAVVFVTGRLAPQWNDVVQDGEFALLPKTAPSRQAEEMFERAFPDEHSPSNIVVVLHRNAPPNAAGDKKFIEVVLEDRLRKIADEDGGLASQPAPSDEPLFGNDDNPAPAAPPPRRSVMAHIHTPNAPGAGALLESPDHLALLVVIDLTTDFTSHANWTTITRIMDMLEELKQQHEVPAGLDISLTGSAVIGRDHTLAELRSVRATETLTVVLVIILLALIYRAPLLALIPLVTVYLAVQVSLNILAILAAHGYLTVFQGIQIYITILAYGAGVDYSLFLTARYKEEMDQGCNPKEALPTTLAGVGGALTASAATVICGIAMMFFAQFGKFRDAGIAIPISLALVLLATLTFSPSLLYPFGRRAFWPQPCGPDSTAARPAHGWRAWFNGTVLQRAWDHIGHLLLRKPGRIWGYTVLGMAPFVLMAAVFNNRLSYDLIGTLPDDAPSVAGTRALEQHFPAGLLGTTTVLLVDKDFDFGSDRGRSVVGDLTKNLNENKAQLELADVRSMAAPLGTMAHVATAIPPTNEAAQEAAERAVREHYLTDLGGRRKIGTQLELVPNQSPFTHSSIDNLARIEQNIRATLPAEVRDSTQIYMLGTTPSIRDVANVTRQDRVRIEVLVLASVFVVLILLLRGLIVPVYLLLSVLFSYYATLGVTFLVFWLIDPHGFTGLDWKVAIFLFTILIAVGEDYNIFLMTRVHEEERRFGSPRGILEALTRTGPIISSCGIIMAGTFATLLAGSLTEMKQLGFALAFGVLLDTFVVRPILVPAFLIMLRTGGLLPPAWRRKQGTTAEAAPAQETSTSA